MCRLDHVAGCWHVPSQDLIRSLWCVSSECHFERVAAYCLPGGHRVLCDQTCAFHTTKIRDGLLQGQAQTHRVMRRPVFELCDSDTWRRKRDVLFGGDWEVKRSHLLWPSDQLPSSECSSAALPLPDVCVEELWVCSLSWPPLVVLLLD